MSLDIGEAFGEGLSRLTTAGGLSLAVAFVAVALVSAVLTQTLLVEGLEALLEFYRGLSPEQLEVSQGEYDRQVSALETQLEVTRESSPLALEALKRLARPEEVFSDARTWSEYVGVVSEKPTYVVTNFTRKNRIRQDFFSGPRGREESLENVKAQFDTERHVFVGVDDEDAELAATVEWEHLPIEQAAEAADWELGDSEDNGGETDDDARNDWP